MKCSSHLLNAQFAAEKVFPFEFRWARHSNGFVLFVKFSFLKQFFFLGRENQSSFYNPLVWGSAFPASCGVESAKQYGSGFGYPVQGVPHSPPRSGLDLKTEQRSYSADDYRDNNGLTPSPQSTPTNNNNSVDLMAHHHAQQQQQQQQQQQLLHSDLYSGHIHLKRPPEGSDSTYLVSSPPPATNCSTGSASSYPSYLSSENHSPLYESSGKGLKSAKAGSKCSKAPGAGKTK